MGTDRLTGPQYTMHRRGLPVSSRVTFRKRHLNRSPLTYVMAKEKHNFAEYFALKSNLTKHLFRSDRFDNVAGQRRDISIINQQRHEPSYSVGSSVPVNLLMSVNPSFTMSALSRSYATFEKSLERHCTNGTARQSRTQ